MDFQVDMSQTHPRGWMTFQKNTDIRTNIFFSLMINKGTFFQDLNFGSELYKIKKVTPKNIQLAAQYAKQSLNWLVQVGKASSVDAYVTEGDTVGSMNITIEVVQANGVRQYYEMFTDVNTGKLSWKPIIED